LDCGCSRATVFFASKRPRWCARKCVSLEWFQSNTYLVLRQHIVSGLFPTQPDATDKIPNDKTPTTPRRGGAHRVECDDDRARPSRPVGSSRTEGDVRQLEGQATARCSTFTMREGARPNTRTRVACLPERPPFTLLLPSHGCTSLSSILLSERLTTVGGNDWAASLSSVTTARPAANCKSSNDS